MTKETAGEDVVDARNAEEAEADEIIGRVDDFDVDSAAFDAQFAEFKQAVSDHAEAEETEEFRLFNPRVMQRNARLSATSSSLSSTPPAAVPNHS